MRVPVLALLFLIACSFSSCADISVHDFGARGDAVFDNTKAFQDALDEAGRTGECVRVPTGQYRFDGVLSIPENTSLEGVCKGYHFPDGTKGTVLLAYAGRDNETSAPFITLDTNSTLRGVTTSTPSSRRRTSVPIRGPSA